MNKEQLKQRIEEITKAVEQSAANHNALIGRLNEAQHMLEMMNKVDEKPEDLIDAVVENM